MIMSEKRDIYKKAEKIVVRKIAGETFLVPVAGKLADMQRIFTLNTVGEFIWERVDGQQDVESIISSVTESFEVDRETAEGDVRQFIGELSKEGLLLPVE